MDLIISIIVLIIASVVLYFKRKYNYWQSIGVKSFETTSIYGNTKGLSKQFHISEFTSNFYQKTKAIGEKYCGLYFFTRPVLLVADLDLVKTILIKDFNIFPNRGFYYNEKDDPVSAHLFNLENDSWRTLRQKLSPTFTSGKLKLMFKTMNDVSEKLITAIDMKVKETQNCLDIKDVVARFTTDVIAETAFGIDGNSLVDENSKLYEFGTKIFSQPSSRFLRFFRSTYKNLSRKLHLKAISKDISEFYLNITRDTLNYREKNPQENRHDFMNLLVQMKHQNILSTEQIAAQSFIFYLAGYETTSSTMTYCAFELSVNENIQNKARENVISVLKKHNNEFTYEAINEMNYLEQCVDETMRKYPVVSILQRTAVSDYKIPNTDVVIEKDQSVWIPVHAIHHDPVLYPNPEQFNPERFSPEEIKKRHPLAFIPFGEGNRICIGARFGKLEAMLGMAKLLYNYKFTLDSTKTPNPLIISPHIVVLTAVDKVVLHMEKILSN